MSNISFESFWLRVIDKDTPARHSYFCSLSKQEQSELVESFKKDGWDRLFIQIHIDNLLDKVKKQYGIDLIDLRIKAIRHRKVFLFDKEIWEDIESMFFEWVDHFDIDIIFGGLKVCQWGKNKQFCKIKAKQHLHWR